MHAIKPKIQEKESTMDVVYDIAERFLLLPLYLQVGIGIALFLIFVALIAWAFEKETPKSSPKKKKPQIKVTPVTKKVDIKPFRFASELIMRCPTPATPDNLMVTYGNRYNQITLRQMFAAMGKEHTLVKYFQSGTEDGFKRGIDSRQLLANDLQRQLYFEFIGRSYTNIKAPERILPQTRGRQL